MCTLYFVVYMVEISQRKKTPIYWAVGQRMPGQRFQKVSVFMMDNWKEVERLDDLDGVVVKCHNVLL